MNSNLMSMDRGEDETPRIHQRMEKTTIQGGRRTQKAKGKASQEKGNQSRTRKEIGSTKEGRGRTIKKGRRRRGRRGRGRRRGINHSSCTLPHHPTTRRKKF